jgi:hypothetical protein
MWERPRRARPLSTAGVADVRSGRWITLSLRALLPPLERALAQLREELTDRKKMGLEGLLERAEEAENEAVLRQLRTMDEGQVATQLLFAACFND